MSGVRLRSAIVPLLTFMVAGCAPRQPVHTSTWGGSEAPSKYDELCGGDSDCVQACDAAGEDPSLQGECDALIQKADRQTVLYSRSHDDQAGATGGWVPASNSTLTPAQIAARSRRAIVSIQAGSSFGTGFAVWRKGWVATNLHVVAGEKDIRVTLADGTKHRVLDVRGLDVDRDLVVLRIQADLHALTLGSPDDVSIGERVVVIGHPLGLEATVSDGLVSAARKMEDGSHVFQISAPISPGSSGGPIIDEHGRVIAIATFLLRGGQNLNFGMSSEYLKPMLKRRFVLAPEKFATKTMPYRVDHSKPAARNVPDFPLSILTGCAGADLDAMRRLVEQASAAAGTMFDASQLAGAAHVYLGASVDLRAKLSQACSGVATELEDLKRRVESLRDDEKAAQLRDAFEGLARVLEKHDKLGR
ncbi:MAG: trypsin-like peptidase domain-containing protein [Polyangiaceae bacterium]